MNPSRIFRMTGVGAFGALLLVGAVSPRRAPAQTFNGFDVYRSNCGGCHELYDPEAPRRTREEWDKILTRMIKVRGATLNKQEYSAVLAYLDSFNRPHRDIQWVDAPAKSHKAALSPADSGKLPPEWVDLTVGADVQVPWAIQGDAATKTAYLSPLKTAGDNVFPVLVDNSGTVKEGGASVRLQMVSGKGNVGAGIVFGFKSPQEYYGVRVSPRDIVVYQVDRGERALISRAPATIALKQWHTLAVQVTGSSATFTLDGKPVPQLTRDLAAYHGGRVGVHTQGDTVAMFDQWQVTVH